MRNFGNKGSCEVGRLWPLGRSFDESHPSEKQPIHKDKFVEYFAVTFAPPESLCVCTPLALPFPAD